MNQRPPSAARLVWLDDLRRDIVYAVRTLTRAPGFTAVAMLTLALGIGAVTVIYSVVYNVAVAPLPYKDADLLVNVFVEDTKTRDVRGNFPPQELRDFRDGNTVFEDVIGTLGQGMRYETADSVEFLRAVWVTPNFFDFMGLPPLLGRTFLPADVSAGAAPVAVLRHRAWLAHFAGDANVVGKTILLDGEARTVIGVMPPRFTWHAADVWIPSALDASVTAGAPGRNFQARLKRGVTVRQAEAELTVLAARRARTYPNQYPATFEMRVLNVIEYTVGPFSGVLYTALAAVGLLLLIACCNVANMLLARATAREREMMIRAALGAGRGRIVRQLMVESILLGAGGTALGCLIAYAGIGALVARLPQNPLPGEVDISLNMPVLLFSLATASLAAVLFGLTPALYTARRDLADGLKSSGKGIAGRRGAFRNALVAVEIALSLVLVLSAGLLMRTFKSITSVDLGFTADNVLLVPVVLPPARYSAPAEKQRFYRESLERVATLPGVVVATATVSIPPFQSGWPSALGVVGDGTAANARVSAQAVTADYFKVLGIQFRRGAPFDDLTLDEKPMKAIVSQTFVDRYLRNRESVGQKIRLSPVSGPEDPSRHGVFEIAGVVGDVRNQGLRQPSEPQVYLQWSSALRGNPSLLVRTAGAPALSSAAIRRELSLVDRQVAVVQLRTLADTLDRSYYSQPRFSMLVLGIFAATGTLLVAIGVFSVMAYSVSRQKKEIAVRLALGASRAHVLGIVLRLGAQLLVIGGGLGLLATFVTSRVLASQLWNVSPHDPWTIAATIGVVTAVALAACYLPARRAMRVDPIAALRED